MKTKEVFFSPPPEGDEGDVDGKSPPPPEGDGDGKSSPPEGDDEGEADVEKELKTAQPKAQPP